jgi:serine/threonine-protein kinase
LKRLRGRLPLTQVLHIGWQVASALVAAHEMGITHRDLKPDNIMLISDPVSATGERAKLLDFGIARLEADTRNGRSLTGSNIMGTPTYMSPEQCRGIGLVSAKSDVYSLGVMLYQLLAGRPPFVSRGAGELLSMHLSQDPPPLHELSPHGPAELAALVHRLLQKDPEQRPTMQQVVTALEQLQARQGAAGAQPAVPTPAPEESSIGFSGDRLSESQAAILGSGIEDEGSTPAADTGGSALAFASTLTSATGSAMQPAGEGTRRLAQPLQPAPPPTLVSGGHSMVGIGERLPTYPRPSSRWSLAAAAALGGGIVAAAAWLMLHPPQALLTPTAHPAPASAGAPSAPFPERLPAPPLPAVKPAVPRAEPQRESAHGSSQAEPQRESAYGSSQKEPPYRPTRPPKRQPGRRRPPDRHDSPPPAAASPQPKAPDVPNKTSFEVID